MVRPETGMVDRETQWRDQRSELPPPKVLVIPSYETHSMEGGVNQGCREGGDLPTPLASTQPARALGSCHLWPENSPSTERCLKIESWGGEHESLTRDGEQWSWAKLGVGETE